MKKKIILLLTVIFIVTLSVPAFAADDLKISLDDAVKMALDSNKDLKATEKGIDSKEELLEDTQTDIKYMPTGEGYNDSDKPLFLSYFNSDYTLRLAKKQLDNDRKQLVIDTKTDYYNCLVLANKVKTQQAAIELDQLRLSQEKARYAVGMSTKAKIDSFQSQLATDQAALEDANANLDNAYSQLNTLLGLDQSARPVLTGQAAAEFQRLDDVDREANIAADGSLDVWTARESSKLATQLKIFETWYDVGKNTEEQSYLTAASTVDKVRVQLREFCNSINYMVEKNNQLQTQLVELDENCRVLQVQYDLGLITRDALLDVQLKRSQLSDGITELTSQYAVAKDTLAKYQGRFKY